MKKVVSLGIHILDVLGRPVTAIPPGQNLALLDEIRVTVAGTAAGTSVDMAKLGLQVTAMGALGEDEIGHMVLSTLQRYGIDTRGLVRKSGVQTSATMLPIRPNGERPALHVIGANGEFALDDVNWSLIEAADFLHVGGTSLMAKFDGRPASEVVKFAKQKGLTTTWDFIGVPKDHLAEMIAHSLPYIDYFAPNIEEASMISGIPVDQRRELQQFFFDRGAKTVIFKMGAQGSAIATHEGELRVPAYKVPVVDTTGCGDAWCGGFITGLAHGWPIERAARLGSACGSLVASGLGSDAGIVDLESTVTFMETAETLPMSG
jgi:sugar/nucleoside kinase (ribokinase family)